VSTRAGSLHRRFADLVVMAPELAHRRLLARLIAAVLIEAAPSEALDAPSGARIAGAPRCPSLASMAGRTTTAAMRFVQPLAGCCNS
jgi:hypothetical protein